MYEDFFEKNKAKCPRCNVGYISINTGGIDNRANEPIYKCDYCFQKFTPAYYSYVLKEFGKSKIKPRMNRQILFAISIPIVLAIALILYQNFVKESSPEISFNVSVSGSYVTVANGGTKAIPEGYLELLINGKKIDLVNDEINPGEEAVFNIAGIAGINEGLLSIKSEREVKSVNLAPIKDIATDTRSITTTTTSTTSPTTTTTTSTTTTTITSTTTTTPTSTTTTTTTVPTSTTTSTSTTTTSVSSTTTTTSTTIPVTGFLVKPYLIYPADKPMYPEYETAVNSYIEELKAWYLQKVGKTFSTTPLQIVRSSRNYLIMRCGDYPTQACINDPSKLEGNWAQYMNEAIHGGRAEYYNGGPSWDKDTVDLVFGAGGGGYAGANARGTEGGWAVVSDWVLEPISGVANTWGIPCSYSSEWQCSGGTPKGTPAHELGHAFGLPHPGQQYCSQTIMECHWNYPVGLLQQETDALRQSPFFQ